MISNTKVKKYSLYVHFVDKLMQDFKYIILLSHPKMSLKVDAHYLPYQYPDKSILSALWYAYLDICFITLLNVMEFYGMLCND